MSSYNFSINGSGPGADLWQLIGGGNNDIELNTGAGVTGIAAPNPSDSNLQLLLNNTAGSAVGAVVYTDTVNNIVYYIGINEGATPPVPTLTAINMTTGRVTVITCEEGTATIQVSSNNGNTTAIVTDGNIELSVSENSGAFNSITAASDQVNYSASDGAGNESQVTVFPTFALFGVTTPGKNTAFTVNTNVGIQLSPDGGTTYVFNVTLAGQIQTNQVAAGAPTAPLPTKKLPIYDTAGTLQGYAALYPS